MVKRLFFVQFLLFFALSAIHAQGFVIHQKDGSLAVFPSENVDSVTMITEDNSYVMGTWYLGIYKNNSNVVHYDGSEYMTFAGNRLLWHRNGKTDFFDIKYYPDRKYISARNIENKTDNIKWYVNRQTPEVLIFRDGEEYRYFYPTQRSAEFAIESHTETTDLDEIMSYAGGQTASTKTPMGRHFENKHVTTDADRTWLLNPDNEPAFVADLKRWVAKTVKLYPYGSPLPADVNQHSIGDCCALAVFASYAYLYPEFIKSIITANSDKSYTVKMYDPQGKPVEVCVSNKFMCDENGNVGQVTGKNNVITWATVLEKAMMKWQAIYNVDGIEGIGTEHASPLFTGNGDSFAFSSNVLYPSELKAAIENCLQQGMITVGGFNQKDLLCGTLKTVTGHAFTFMLADDDNSIFYMRNPWGNGDNGEDGLLRIPNNPSIVKTIDARIVNPGAAAPYLREDLQPYTPPKYIRRPTDLGVSPRLMNHVFNPEKPVLW